MKITIALLSFLFLSLGSAYSQELPRKSPQCVLYQKVGLTDVKISYSRPGVRGRKGKIWGTLVPYNQMWRTGANEASLLSVSDSFQIQGKTIQAGTFAIFTVPRKKGAWDFIVTKDTSSWGTTGYSKANEVARVLAIPNKKSFTEELTFDFVSLDEDRATLEFSWEKIAIKLDMKFFTEEKAAVTIQKALSETSEEEWEPYAKAARYYTLHNMSSEKAMLWADIALKRKPDHYLTNWVKAEVLAAKRDYKGAIKFAEEAITYGIAIEGNSFEYRETLKNLIHSWSSLDR